MTPIKRLYLIHELLHGDIGFNANCYPLNKKPDKDAKRFAELLMHIYRITHPAFGCSHTDWDAKSEEELTKIK